MKRMNDDLLIKILNLINVPRLFDCIRVNHQWKRVADYLIHIHRDCLWIRWRKTRSQLIKNQGVVHKQKLPQFDSSCLFIEGDGMIVRVDDIDEYLHYRVDFYSYKGDRVSFDLRCNVKSFPHCWLPHYLADDGLIVIHFGFHDDSSDEIDYHHDYVFNINDLSNITMTKRLIESVPKNLDGRCGLCKRWAKNTKTLPVGVVNEVVGYMRNVFYQPMTLLNEPGLVRTISSSWTKINVFDNGSLVKSIDRTDYASLIEVDADHILINNYYLSPKIINVFTEETFVFPLLISAKENIRFDQTGGMLLMIMDDRCSKVTKIDKRFKVGKSHRGRIPAFCPIEQRILFFDR